MLHSVQAVGHLGDVLPIALIAHIGFVYLRINYQRQGGKLTHRNQQTGQRKKVDDGPAFGFDEVVGKHLRAFFQSCLEAGCGCP